jgi:hypothetical protein
MRNLASIFDRVIQPEQGSLSEAHAQYVLSLCFTQDEKSRYSELSGKDQSELTADEKAELQLMVGANTLLMLMQAKARLSLDQQKRAT